MSEKVVKKIRSKNYPLVIQVNAPVRFYWSKNSYDGFEFGPLDHASRHQLKLLRQIMDLMMEQMQSVRVVKYLKTNHNDVYSKILEEIKADVESIKGIPNTFVDAFEDKLLE